MQKGINLIINSLKDDIAKIINEVGLPIGVVEMILKEMTIEVSNSNRQQIEREKEMYNTGLQEENSVEVVQ